MNNDNDRAIPPRIWIDLHDGDAEPLPFVYQRMPVYTRATKNCESYVHESTLTTIREEARRAAFKDCITEFCIDCAEGDEPTFDAQAKWYYHDAGTSSAVGCSASKLRIRAAALPVPNKKPTCVKCGHSDGVERTLKRCKARTDGGEALCQCHCVFPAATPSTATAAAPPVLTANEQWIRNITPDQKEKK